MLEGYKRGDLKGGRWGRGEIDSIRNYKETTFVLDSFQLNVTHFACIKAF